MQAGKLHNHMLFAVIRREERSFGLRSDFVSVLDSDAFHRSFVICCMELIASAYSLVSGTCSWPVNGFITWLAVWDSLTVTDNLVRSFLRHDWYIAGKSDCCWTPCIYSS